LIALSASNEAVLAGSYMNLKFDYNILVEEFLEKQRGCGPVYDLLNYVYSLDLPYFFVFLLIFYIHEVLIQ
jgi:hypothetical protein